MPKAPSTITALTLLETATELQRMYPHANEIRFKELWHNTSFTIRVAQLKVLIPIFIPEISHIENLKEILEAIDKGDFILARDISIYKKLIKSMEEILKKEEPGLRKREPWRVFDIRNNYTNLKQYKQKVDKVLSFNEGLLATNFQFHYSVLQVQNSNKNISIPEINNFLSLCIDPLARTFTKQHLIENFNYPKENIQDVDTSNI